MMIFDGGVLTPDEISRIRLPRIELKGHAFLDPAEALDMVEPDLRKRMKAALAVGAGDSPCYLENGHPMRHRPRKSGLSREKRPWLRAG